MCLVLFLDCFSIYIFYRQGRNTAIIDKIESGNVQIANLKKHSVKIFCSNCQKENFTRVESNVSGDGKKWAICCCCFGSLWLSFLVFCLDGFREFTHYCTSCNANTGTHKPSFSGGVICLLILLTLVVIGVQVLIVVFYLTPMIQTMIDNIH